MLSKRDNFDSCFQLKCIDNLLQSKLESSKTLKSNRFAFVDTPVLAELKKNEIDDFSSGVPIDTKAKVCIILFFWLFLNIF